MKKFLIAISIFLVSIPLVATENISPITSEQPTETLHISQTMHSNILASLDPFKETESLALLRTHFQEKKLITFENVNLQDNQGNTLLHLCLKKLSNVRLAKQYSFFLNIITYLVEKSDIDIYLKDNRNKATIATAATLPKNTSYTKEDILHIFLAQDPLCIQKSDTEDNSIIMSVLERESYYNINIDFITFLLKHGANPNYSNQLGNKPLFIAIHNIQLFNLLLTCEDIKLNILNEYNQSLMKTVLQYPQPFHRKMISQAIHNSRKVKNNQGTYSIRAMPQRWVSLPLQSNTSNHSGTLTQPKCADYFPVLVALAISIDDLDQVCTMLGKLAISNIWQ